MGLANFLDSFRSAWQVRPSKFVAANPNPTIAPTAGQRELRTLLGIWLALAVAVLWLGSVTATSLGFNYDEAIFAGLAKDFTTGEVHGHHMPGSGTVNLWNRPFPIWNQPLSRLGEKLAVDSVVHIF